MDCKAPTAFIMEVLRDIFYHVAADNLLEVHPSDREKMKDDKWLKSVLDSKGGDMTAAVQTLVDRNVGRKVFGVNSKKYNVKQDKKHSKAVKPVGKDNKGFKVLFVDLSEICYFGGDEELLEHIIYWMERLDRQGNEKISFVLHHGKRKFMERALNLMMALKDVVFPMYPGFTATIFIFEDLVSTKCKFRLNSLFNDKFTFVDESSWSGHFKLDEKYDLSEGYLKLAQKKPDTVEKCDKSTAALGEQCSEEIKKPESEILDNVGDKEMEQRNKLKLILARLHDVENQVFQLIRDVQELI